MKSSRRTLVVASTLGIALVLAITVLAIGRSSHEVDQVAWTEDAPVATTSTTMPPTTSTTIPGPATTPGMPVAVDVSTTSGLRSGTPVRIHAAPSPGSQMFGVEARLCRGDVSVLTEGDFAPTRGAKCIANPLAPNTDAKVQVAGTPPYAGLDLTFVVGAGTDTFRSQYDGTVSISCDASHPCQIVLKLQYPDGFGFQGIPVTFS